jgi:DNA-binding NarL/FixJ family response regulator
MLFMAEAIRLVVAHDHRLFRQCLASVLAADSRFSIVEAGLSDELLALIKDQGAQLVLLDLEASSRIPLELTRKIHESFPLVKIILLGMPETREVFLECVEAGAHGYVVKDGTLADLSCAIQSAMQDGAVCSPELTLSLFEKLAALARECPQGSDAAPSPLTFRQMEIVKMISNGLSNKQIARQLRLSLYTVKNHIHNILSILQVDDRWEAAECARRNRWVHKTKG